MRETYQQAIKALENAKTVQEWNKIRAQWVPTLTQGEIALIDSGGLIVKLLGKDKQL